MKIAAITNSRIPSLTANSIQAMKVCQVLADIGHEICIFAPHETEPVSREELVAHYGLRIVPNLEWLPSIRRFKRLDFIIHAQRAAESFGADLIYTWLPQSAVAALWRDYPTIIEMHSDVGGRMGAWWIRQFWKTRGKKLMTVTTQALRKALERSAGFGFEDDVVLIAPNGVELERYDDLPDAPGARQLLALENKLTVGFTGHIYPGRGADLLFELAQRMPDVNFLWVGGTPELVSYWREKLESVGAKNVTMTGFVKHERIPLYQAAAEILLMPYSRSIKASSGQDIAEVINPMKMFEYMASGRTIITADLPVIREVLNETNAVFCEPDDEEDWKLGIEKLLADEPSRLALGKKAMQDVQEYTWLARAEKIMRSM